MQKKQKLLQKKTGNCSEKIRIKMKNLNSEWARWLFLSLHSKNETIFRVVRGIFWLSVALMLFKCIFSGAKRWMKKDWRKKQAVIDFQYALFGGLRSCALHRFTLQLKKTSPMSSISSSYLTRPDKSAILRKKNRKQQRFVCSPFDRRLSIYDIKFTTFTVRPHLGVSMWVSQ